MPSARASASPIREQSGSSRRRRPKLSPNRFGILKPQAFSTQRSARWTEITGLLRPSSTVSPRGSPKTIRDHPKPANEKLTQDVDRRRVCSVDVSNALTEEKKNKVMALGRLDGCCGASNEKPGPPRNRRRISEGCRDRCAISRRAASSAVAFKTGQRGDRRLCVPCGIPDPSAGPPKQNPTASASEPYLTRGRNADSQKAFKVNRTGEQWTCRWNSQ